jgi:CRP/FNR family cyclic AMP-dependent transcriptional regulator
MPDGATVDFLASIPLLEGRDEADLLELARVLRRRTVAAGEMLWQQGDDARELVLIRAGAVAASLRVPGGHTAEIGSAGPGEIVGEIGLLDGGQHTMSVRVTESATLLALGSIDLAALLARQDSSAFTLKRRLAALLAARHRNQLEHLAVSLGGEPAAAPSEDAERTFAELEYCGAPDSKYVRRMASFHDVDPLALWGLLTSGNYARCPPGRTLLAEGAPAPACYLTINGAVEKVLLRGERRIRVGLAGPGKAFGYDGLIDGLPTPFSAITRERALLLVLPRDRFGQLFNGDDAVSRVFLDVIQRDLVATLRQGLRPHARLAASV